MGGNEEILSKNEDIISSLKMNQTTNNEVKVNNNFYYQEYDEILLGSFLKYRIIKLNLSEIIKLT